MGKRAREKENSVQYTLTDIFMEEGHLSAVPRPHLSAFSIGSRGKGRRV